LAAWAVMTPIGPAPAIRTAEPGTMRAFRAAQMPTDSGSSIAAASSESASGTGWAKIRLDRDVFAERTVDGWCRIEPHVGAQVVAARFALRAHPAGTLRLDGDPLTETLGCHRVAEGHDAPTRFVTEHQGGVDDEVTDAALAVVVHVRAAHPHRRDFDEDLVG